MDDGKLIRVENLRGGYGDDLVLDDVSLSVKVGEIMVIVGRSGCGKSTLMRYLIGLARPWSGRVVFSGQDLWADPSVLDRARKRWGVLFQSGALLASFNLMENVSLPLVELTRMSQEEMELVARRKLEVVGLAHAAEDYPLSVSGGMQKRAALARAMALDPEVLFFDEPSSGLDPITSHSLDLLIKRINRELGTTMVIVTHELPSVFAISDRVVMLDGEAKGVIAEGTAAQLRDLSTDPRVKSFFNPEKSEQEEQ
ncbi:ATP-binding cassette domain-containing protein [Candidatus Fermentibacteria bacterium]|nr:ATP-binding cassette domain-containing protein [Candidatus Fermentibacteria bacterium]